MQAAVARREPLDHLLLYGPPGLGKTTLAGIIAAEMGHNIRITSGPAIERAGDLASILTNLSAGDVLFIDEIHRLSHAVEEVLYPAMEDFALDIMIGKGPSARSIRLDLPKFTLIGATTRAGMLTSPLRDRFGINFRLELYTPEELSVIVLRSAKILKIPCDQAGAWRSPAARGARRALPTASFAACATLPRWRVGARSPLKWPAGRLRCSRWTNWALTTPTARCFRTMIEKFGGGPVGLDTLAASTGEDAVTIEDVYEPYFLQLGFIMRTPRGRVATAAAYEHLGLTPPAPKADADQMRMDL